MCWKIFPVSHLPQAQRFGPGSSETPLFSSTLCQGLTWTFLVWLSCHLPPTYLLEFLKDSPKSSCSEGGRVLLSVSAKLMLSICYRLNRWRRTNGFHYSSSFTTWSLQLSPKSNGWLEDNRNSCRFIHALWDPVDCITTETLKDKRRVCVWFIIPEWNFSYISCLNLFWLLWTLWKKKWFDWHFLCVKSLLTGIPLCKNRVKLEE